MNSRRNAETVTISARVPANIRREISDYVLLEEDQYLAEFVGEMLVDAWQRYREDNNFSPTER